MINVVQFGAISDAKGVDVGGRSRQRATILYGLRVEKTFIKRLSHVLFIKF